MPNKPKASPDSIPGAIRARDVRFQLQGHNVDPAVVRILEALAEQARAQEKSIQTLAELIDRTTDIVVQFSTVAYNMKSAIDSIKVAYPELGVQTGADTEETEN